jgi:hypothetical protein
MTLRWTVSGFIPRSFLYGDVGVVFHEGKLISFVLIAYRLHLAPPLAANRSCSTRFKSIQFGPLNLTLDVKPHVKWNLIRSDPNLELHSAAASGDVGLVR